MKIKKPKFWDKKRLSFWAIILLPFSAIYLFFTFLNKIKKKKYFKIPIICVGNIYLGGTGKTPVTIEIFKILRSFGKNPGFVKKYYNYIRDETNMLKKIGPTFVSKKRNDAIKALINKNHDIAILDDGFQDSTINKNFSLICFNKKQWIGNGFSLPSGPLREKFSSIKRADCIIINGEKDINIETKILSEKEIKIFYSKYVPINIEKFRNKRIVAFAGIGNPHNFIELLHENNLNVVDSISYPDHYNYTVKDLNFLKNKANKFDAILLTTEKDYFRLDDNLKLNIEFLKVELEIEKKEKLLELIKSYL